MYKYRSRCRWNILLYIGGNIKEIRPGEVFTYHVPIESRFVELQETEIKKKELPKKAKLGRPKKKKEISSIFLENADGSSSTES